MNRKTLTALGLFAVLCVAALVALRQPEKGERNLNSERPIPQLLTTEFDTLEVTRGGTTTVLKHEGDKYKVVTPVTYPADQTEARGAFDSLARISHWDLVTDQPAKQAEFEVDDKSGVHLVVKNGAKVLTDFIVGKSASAGTMVRLPGKNEIWQIDGIAKYPFDKGPTDWRDKSITTFTAPDAERLEVAAKDGAKVTVKKTGTKEGSEDKWDVVDSSEKIAALDNSVPNGIVSALAAWKANDFADTITPEAAGLAPPALTVTVSLKDNKKTTVLVGNKKGEDELYVKKPDAPQIFVVKKYNADRVNKRPLEFREKTICNIADTDVAEIAVSHGDNSYTLVKSGSDWKATKPAKLDIDQSKVTPIAGAFKDWKGTSFAEDQSPKANGLAKPMATIAIKGKKPAVCTVKVGDETKDKLSYFVTGAKGPDVYLASKWSVDRVLVKVADLKKAATALAKK
jgi:hypothetical protein